MSLLYSWATKEYLLERMSFGQIMAYYNKGIEMKFGKQQVEIDDSKKTAKQLIDEGKKDVLLEQVRRLREIYGLNN